MCLPSSAPYNVPSACGIVSSSTAFFDYLARVQFAAHGGRPYHSRQVTPMVPLFRCRNGQTLRQPQVVRAIKWLTSQLGCDPAQFSGHSLWWGGATSAAEAGLPAETIQQLGGWHFDTWQQYIQFPMAELASRTANAWQ